MGFPSPAADYVEERISLDQRFIAHPSATYMMVAGTTYLRAGILKGAMLIVDSSLTLKDGSLLVCAIDGNLKSGVTGRILSLIWRTLKMEGESRCHLRMKPVTLHDQCLG